jgi:glycogen phosphorylase
MDEMIKASAVPQRREHRGFDAVRFSGEANALFERHLRFDGVVDPAAAGARDKFEAAAHAVRDMLTQRWIQTQQTYDRENPKRVYYLSMEFLIGRSLTNNITNLMLHSAIGDAARATGLDWVGLVELIEIWTPADKSN